MSDDHERTEALRFCDKTGWHRVSADKVAASKSPTPEVFRDVFDLELRLRHHCTDETKQGQRPTVPHFEIEPRWNTPAIVMRYR
jgi:hypothetical protein